MINGSIIKEALAKPKGVLLHGPHLLRSLHKLRFDLNEKLAILTYMGEFYSSHTFHNQIAEKIKEVATAHPNIQMGGWLSGYPLAAVYALVRFIKPKYVVETGVGAGGSSSAILLALQRNGTGELHSIDLPEGDQTFYPPIGKPVLTHVPPGLQTGWLIPPDLRRFWHLHLGDARALLPQVVSELSRVDIFLHDSLHTPEHIRFELEEIFTKVPHGGILLADDVNEGWTLEFLDFCREKKLPAAVLGNRLGIARKL